MTTTKKTSTVTVDVLHATLGYESVVYENSVMTARERWLVIESTSPGQPLTRTLYPLQQVFRAVEVVVVSG